MKLIVALAATSLLAGASSQAAADRAAAGAIPVAIYRGPAACDDCSEALARAIATIGPRYQVTFVGPNERIDVTPASLRRYRIYVQPGGGQDIDGARASLGDGRVNAIRGFVAQGGGYLGLCMGAYLAGQSQIGLISGDLDSEVGRPGSAVRTIDDAVIAVRWAGRSESVFFQDGPFLHPRVADRAYRAVATYANGDLAAARYSRGKGLVVLSGPHPEADASWFADAAIPLDRMPTGKPLKTLLDQFAT